MNGNEPIKLTSHDLFTPRVDAYIEEQAVLGRTVPTAAPRPLIVRIVYSSSFYLGIAGMIGALAAWACLEPAFSAHERQRHEGEAGATLLAFLMFPTVVAGIALFLGAAEGVMCRNPGRAAISALVGLGIGFVAGGVAAFGGGIVFGLMTMLAVGNKPSADPDGMPTGFGLLIFIMGRGAAWAINGIPAGLGQGVALRNRKMAINGIVGGVLGGVLGGMLFDPIWFLIGRPEVATLSRCIGFAVIGLLVGVFIGLVEGWTKSAWLLMQAGPLAGKQFILFRNPTTIGSSPKCDVYLFKDPAIEPQHALIHDRGGRFEIQDMNSADGTYVNGRPVTKPLMLTQGDQIVIGKTVLEFSTRDRN